MEKTEMTGIAVLSIGIALLVTTFIDACMGLIGSTVTKRGITLLLQVKLEAKTKIQRKAKPKAEREDFEEAWEKALQEAKLDVESGRKSGKAGLN